MKSHVLVAALAAALLAGCVTTSAPPVTTTMKIPVMEKCDAPVPSAPAFAVDALPIGAPIDEQMRALRAERHQRIGYELELEAAVRACR